MDQITHSIRQTNWSDIISQCRIRSEGMTVHRWLADNGIKENSYYYWLRKFRKEAYKSMSTKLNAVSENSAVAFAEIQIPRTTPVENTMPYTIKPSAVIKTSTMTIVLSNDISDALLSRILQVVRHA